MLKAIEKLLNGSATHVGNHRVETTGKVTYYFYHSTAVCTVNTVDGTVKFDNGGWGTMSTTRAINNYKKYFVDGLGFTVVDTIKG